MTTYVKDNWYEEFFHGINCELWIKAIRQQITIAEVDFLDRNLAIPKGNNILDIPCGFGRHSISLARRGYAVTGLDISSDFITVMRKQVTKENLNVEAIHGDILKIGLSKLFDGAICMGNSFGYFDKARMRIFVQKVSTCLKPGAKFIINTAMMAESIFPNFPAEKSFQVEDILMEIKNEYHSHLGYMQSEITYTRNAKKEFHTFKHYVFTVSEIISLLHEFGLGNVKLFNSPNEDHFKLGDPQLYLVFEKR